MTPRLSLLFFGSSDFSVPTLRALAAGPFDVRAVYTQPDRPAGRGRKPRPSPVALAARELGLPLEQPERVRDDAVLERLEGYAPDAVVLAAYGLIIPSRALAAPRLGWLNVHPSLLPAYRGASPVAAPILRGDEVTGVSIFLMREGLDDGPVLAQEETPIGGGETAGELTERLALEGAELLVRTLDSWAEGAVEPREQDHHRASYAPKLSKEDAPLDWGLPAETLERRVRAYNPWPVCYALLEGQRLRVLRAVAQPEAPGLPAGAVYRDPALPFPLVACAEGALGLTELQLPGGRPLDGESFLRGHPSFVGARL